MTDRFRHGPMAFLSGLSPINPTGKGAWLSPINPTGKAAWLSPINPPVGKGAWLSPINPPDGSGAGNSPINPPKKRQGLPADDPETEWEGVDPPWTYASEATLLAQALRKSRVKTQRVSDLAKRPSTGAAPAQPFDPLAPAWRWAPPFRIAAAVAELSARLPVQGPALWHVEGQGALRRGRQALQAEALFYVDVDALAQVDWDRQIDKVVRAAVEREDRLPEILTQAGDLWPFFVSVTGLALDRAPVAGELLAACETWVLQSLMLLKHQVAALRPNQRSSLVVPVIETPGHGSVPSGHATVAAFHARMLTHLLPIEPTRRALLDRLARRIAFNRVVAGVHCPVDNRIGYELGRTMADAVAMLAGAPSQDRPLSGDDTAWIQVPELPERDDEAAPPQGARPTWAPSALISTLWLRAGVEIAALRV